MTRGRGKRTAALAVVIGLAAIAGAGIALRDRILDEWDIRNLSHDDPAVRERAARRLGERRVARAVPALFEAFRKEIDAALSGGDPPPALQALVRIGGPAEDALVNAVDDEDPKLREFAFRWILRVDSPPGAVVPALTRALRFPDEPTRSDVLYFLSSHGPAAREAVPALIDLLRSGDSEWWLPVAHAVWEIDRSDPELSRALVSGLAEADPMLRQAAAQYLGELGPRVREACSALLVAAEDANGQVRAQALRALSKVGCDPALLGPRVLHSLRSPDYDARWSAACVARHLAADAKDAVPLLIEMLDSEFELLRDTAMAALSRIGPPAIAGLVPALEHENPLLRERAARALGAFGPGAKDAVPALARALRDAAPGVRSRAIGALGEIGPAAEAARSDLEALVEKEADAQLGVRAALALARMGSLDAALVEVLRRALGSTSTGVRAEAALALAHAGGSGHSAIPSLEAALGDRNAIVRTFAAWALERIEPGRGRKEKAFTEAFARPEVQVVVAEALAGLPGIGHAVLPELMALLVEKEPAVRIAAALAIGRIGRGARTAVPALLACVRLTEEEDQIEFPRVIPRWSDHVELAVTEAIERIQGSSDRALEPEGKSP